jgi:hypothetical protein
LALSGEVTIVVASTGLLSGASLELFRLAPADARDRGLDAAASGVRLQSGRLAIRPR